MSSRFRIVADGGDRCRITPGPLQSMQLPPGRQVCSYRASAPGLASASQRSFAEQIRRLFSRSGPVHIGVHILIKRPEVGRHKAILNRRWSLQALHKVVAKSSALALRQGLRHLFGLAGQQSSHLRIRVKLTKSAVNKVPCGWRIRLTADVREKQDLLGVALPYHAAQILYLQACRGSLWAAFIAHDEAPFRDRARQTSRGKEQEDRVTRSRPNRKNLTQPVEQPGPSRFPVQQDANLFYSRAVSRSDLVRKSLRIFPRKLEQA